MHNTDTEIEFSPDQLAIREQVASQIEKARSRVEQYASHGIAKRIGAPFDPARSVEAITTAGPKRTHRPKGTGSFYYHPSKRAWVGRMSINGKRYEVSGKSREDVVTKLGLAISPTPTVAALLKDTAKSNTAEARSVSHDDIRAAAFRLNQERHPEPNPYVPSTRRPRGTGWIGFDKERNRWRGQLRQNGQNIQVYGHSREEVEAKLKQTQAKAAAQELNRQRYPESALVTYEVEVRQVLHVDATSIDDALQHIRYGYPGAEIFIIRKGKT